MHCHDANEIEMKGAMMDATSAPVTEGEVSQPEFTIAMRGYDRMQVDEYILRLGRWTDEAQARAVEGERRVAHIQRENQELRRRIGELEQDSGSPAAALENLGGRIESMLTEATRECDEIRQRGVDEAN